MKNNLLRTILEWMLITSLVLSGFFFMRYYFQSQELRLIEPQYQQEVMNYQAFINFVNALKAEVGQYGQREPGLFRFLEAAGVNVTGTAPTNATPASKPAEK